VALGGCIRFSNDAPLDASADAAEDAAGEVFADAESGTTADVTDSSRHDAADAQPISDGSADAADAIPPPICSRFDPSIRFAIASDLVSALLQDCKIRSAFVSLPPVQLEHFEECFAAQVASVLGCVNSDGTRFKYPAYDSNGEFCRDMKTAHAGVNASDGDFDAFLAAIMYALGNNGLTDDEIVRAMRTFGAGPTRSDIVKLKDAGPTQPCDAGADAGLDAARSESGSDAGADAHADVSLDAGPEAAPREGGADVSTD
jgi:hypothetical protein